MHSLKRDAQPQDHSKPKHYNPCPKCGNPKTPYAEQCLSCKVPRSPERPEIVIIEGERCRYIPLTHGLYTIVDAHLYDSLSKQIWTADVRRTYNGKPVYYATGKRKGKNITLHRQIIKCRNKHVDHRNHDTLDNRRSNLRACTVAQNIANSMIRSTNKSGYKGVCLFKQNNKWRATIVFQGKQRALGYYYSKIEAAKAYDRAATELFGDFAHTNFPIKSD